MKKNSLLSFFEALSSKIECCLLPKNIVSRLGFFKLEDTTSIQFREKFGKINNSLFRYSWIIILCFYGLFMSNKTLAQTAPSQPSDCKIGCTSNDVQIQNAYLSDANGNKLPSNFVCPTNGSAAVYLTLELTTRTPRIGVVIYTNIKRFTPPATIGLLVTTFSECFGNNLNQPTNKVTFSQTFTWTCGTPIVLTDVFIGWGTGNSNFCIGSGFQCPATSSKCYALPPGQYIAVQTPVANTASATTPTIRRTFQRRFFAMIYVFGVSTTGA